MKKILFCSAACAALFTTIPAHAQDYSNAAVYAKGGNGRMEEDLKPIEPPVQAPEQTQIRAPVRTYEPVATTTTTTSSASTTTRTAQRSRPLTGFYLGADVGYGIGSADVDGGPAPGDGDVGIDGFSGGPVVGYGFGLGERGYLGVEGGYTWADEDGDIAGTEVKKDDGWQVSLRPGMTMGGSTLAYGVVGYTRTEFKAGGNEEKLDGLQLGAGAEFDSGMPVRMRVEYLYTDYKDDDIGGLNVDPHDNTIKLGAVYRFNQS